MASPGSRKISDITEVIQRHFDCPVCFEQYTEANPAKSLPCQHAFCLQCLEKVNNAGRIQCPHCKVSHVVPKGGINNFRNNYQLMQIMGDIDIMNSQRKRKDGSCGSKSERILCDLAIGQVETVHNKVKECQNQADDVFDHALDVVDISCEDATKAVTSEIDKLVKRLRQEEAGMRGGIAVRAGAERHRIEELKSEVSGAIDAVARRCDDKLQEFRQSRRLTGDQWESFQQENDELNEALNGIARANGKLSYKTVSFSMFGKEGDENHELCVDVEAMVTKTGRIQETTHEDPLLKIGNGILTLPDQRRCSGDAIVRPPDRRRPSSDSQAKPPPSGSAKNRDRRGDREVVKVLQKGFSTDSPSYNGARVILTVPNNTGEKTDNLHKPPVSPKPIIQPLSAPQTFSFAVKTSPKSYSAPPLPTRALHRQQRLDTLPEEYDSIAKVVVKLHPCAVLKSTDDHCIQMSPRGITGLEGGRVAVASDDGLRLFDEHNCEIMTPRRQLVAVKNVHSVYHDVCCLPNGTIMMTVQNQCGIVKYSKDGMPRGEWSVNDVGGRLRKPVRPFGITCDSAENVYISDSGNRCVLVCRLDGTLRKIIGGSGLPAEQQLQEPTYLALFQPTETVLYVTDFQRGSIMKYTVDGDFICSYLERGSERAGNLAAIRPVGVTATPCGNVSVVDSASQSILLIDSRTGDLMKRFGANGGAPGEFDLPLGLACVNNKLAVCDYNNGRVQFFEI